MALDIEIKQSDKGHTLAETGFCLHLHVRYH